MIGLRLKAKVKAVIKRNTFKDLLCQSSWKQWNHIRHCKKHYGKITTKLEARNIQPALKDAIYAIGNQIFALKFWFRNMQEIAGVVDTREIRHICSIWTKCFDQCLLKRFLGYWNKHYEVVHGLFRREMHQLVQRHINNRAYRRSIRLWSTYVS